MRFYNPLVTSLIIAFASLNAVAQTPIEKKDSDEIRFLARKKVEGDLSELLNTLSFEDLGEFERESVMRNSYLPNSNQVFHDDAVIIEDDINAVDTSRKSTSDLEVARYLKNFDLYYQKSSQKSVQINNLLVSEVKQGSSYLFVQVYFQIHFKGKHSNGTTYKPTWRIAELRADRNEKQWSVFITGIGFFDPTNIPKETNKQKLVTKQTVPNRRLVPKILSAVIGLGAGGYAYLLNSQYQTKLNNLSSVSQTTDSDGDNVILTQAAFTQWETSYKEVKNFQSKKTTMYICLGVAGAAAIAEIILLVKKPKRKKQIGFNLQPSTQNVGLALRYSF